MSVLLTVGRVVDACVKLTTEEWFRQHGGMRSREEAFAEDVKALTTSTSREPGGKLTVTVGVAGRKRVQEQVDFYRFQRRNGDGYVQEEPSNPRR
jgi:hypothetical protein